MKKIVILSKNDHADFIVNDMAVSLPYSSEEVLTGTEETPGFQTIIKSNYITVRIPVMVTAAIGVVVTVNNGTSCVSLMKDSTAGIIVSTYMTETDFVDGAE